MWNNLLLLLLFIGFLDGRKSLLRRQCALPKIDNGRVRIRGRMRPSVAKVTCFTGYELAGNRYMNCEDGRWNAPAPVCVRRSINCSIPTIDNALVLPSHGGAYLTIFCHPSHTMVGPSAVYCNGKSWNATLPTCVESKRSNPALTCDFESEDLCGWTQDDFHDFDWRRWNKGTPSAYFETGPSFDHTLGDGRPGYYLYIESSGEMRNNSARIISPLYSKELAKSGCFSFYYHMYGKDNGGLRVFEKPDDVPMDVFQNQNSNKSEYLLFEVWGNRGNRWFRNTSMLHDFDTDFQIIIEGIRGTSFTSDLAIDDVAILQNDACAQLMSNNTDVEISTPAPTCPEDCPQGQFCHTVHFEGRLEAFCVDPTLHPNILKKPCLPGYEVIGKECYDINECATSTHDCPVGQNCMNTRGWYLCVCPLGHYKNLHGVCVSRDSCVSRCTEVTKNEESVCECNLKCMDVGTCCPDYFDVCYPGFDFGYSTTDEPPQTEKLIAVTTTEQTTTSTTTTPKPTTQSTIPTMSTTKKLSTTTKILPTTTKLPITTLKTTTPRATTKKVTDTPKPFTLVFKTTTKMPERFTTQKSTTVRSTFMTSKAISTTEVNALKEKTSNVEIPVKWSSEQLVVKGKEKRNGISFGVILLSVIAVLGCICGATWLILAARSSVGTNIIVRLKGRVANDPEVRFLTREDDD